MSETNITLVFDGPAVENGEIDVQDLAPALLAMGNLVQAANGEINGDKAQVAVKVRATAEGSFEVDLTVLQSLMESAKTLLDVLGENKDSIASAKNLTEILFKAGAGGAGLMYLIKSLRGKKPDKVEQKGGDVHVTMGDVTIITSPQAYKLAESIPVREHAKKAIAALSDDGIDKMKVKQKGSEDLEISKSEVGYFEYEDTEEELADTEREMNLQIISLSFKEDNKWRVTDGGEPFSATIEDTAFLNKIANDEIAFSKGDYLRCKVREKQSRSSKGLKIERSIIEVLEHKFASQQLRLI